MIILGFLCSQRYYVNANKQISLHFLHTTIEDELHFVKVD